MRANNPETEVKWCQRVDAWRQSGQSAKQFAAQSGFSVSSLMAWAGHFRSATKSAPSVAPKIVPIVRVAQPVVHSALVLELGGARLRVEPGFDAELLAALVRALREAT